MSYETSKSNRFSNTRNSSSVSVVQKLSSTPRTVWFRVCRTDQNRDNTISTYIFEDNTLEQLKWKIYEQLHLETKPTDFSLTIFDETDRIWIPIHDDNKYNKILDLKLPYYPILNIEEREETNSSEQHISMIHEDRLTLKLCKQPMNRSNCIYLHTYPSTTLGQLKEQAREKAMNQPTDHLFLWAPDGWKKLETTSDDMSLSKLGFTSYSIISFETRDTIGNELILKLCKQPMEISEFIYLSTYSLTTLGQLKEQARKEVKNQTTDHLFLWTPDGWKKFETTFDDVSLTKLGFTLYSIISFETRDTVGNELILKLCKQPMNKSKCIYLTTYSSTSLGHLKEQARKEVTDQRTDHLLLWTKDGWTEFETTLDDVSLVELGFTEHSIISFQTKDAPIPGVCGLTNLGNTCFMNSALQCLSNIPEFTRNVLLFDDDMNAPVIGAYSVLIKTIWLDKHVVTTPSSLLLNICENLPRFTRYRQHDAQEFMNYFLHLIHQELTNERTLITDLFYGQIQSNVKCLGGCNFIETNEERISFLPLPIDNDINQYNILYLQSNGEQRLVSIRACVKSIDALIDSFIKQHQPELSSRRIKVVRIIDNKIIDNNPSSSCLTDTVKYKLTFIEVPEKTEDQKYIELQFLDRKTNKPFRPPVFLVGPSYDCRYSDLSEQIKHIQNHLCSVTSASTSECYFYWTSRSGKTHDFNAEMSNDNAPILSYRLVIEMNPEWIQKYKNLDSFDRTINNASLTNLLKDFFKEELLDGDYYCSKCLGLQKATQKASLAIPLPPVLIIQLKRFTYDAYSDEKIDTYIDFPIKDLDLSEYVNDNSQKNTKISALYDLVAVSNHTGSLISGHYTTYARNDRNNIWYSFNDERTREIQNEKDIVTKNAYILVYIKRTV